MEAVLEGEHDEVLPHPEMKRPAVAAADRTQLNSAGTGTVYLLPRILSSEEEVKHMASVRYFHARSTADITVFRASDNRIYAMGRIEHPNCSGKDHVAAINYWTGYIDFSPELIESVKNHAGADQYRILVVDDQLSTHIYHS